MLFGGARRKPRPFDTRLFLTWSAAGAVEVSSVGMPPDLPCPQSVLAAAGTQRAGVCLLEAA